VDCPDRRPWEISTLTGNGTPGRAAAYLPRAPFAFAFALALACLAAALPGEAGAAIDLTAKVHVELMARPAAASNATQDFMVRDGGVLRSGDGVQLRVQADADAYVYVIAYGSSGSAMLLRPFSEKPGDALIRQGQAEVLPESGDFLPLDDREGREALFTIISAVPLKDITDLLPRLEAQGGNLNAATAAVRAAYPQARRLSFKHIGARPLVGIAATTPRSSPGPAAGAQPEAASVLPPAGGGWTVPSDQSFGTAAASTAEPVPAAAPSSAGSTGIAAAAGAVAVTRDGPAEPAASDEPLAADADEISPALRKAREAAGIDEDQFRGILATLPSSGQVEVPKSLRKPSTEQGVLSAEGSRIRALDSVQLESDQGWPPDEGEAPTKIQN
jgi:hypothetical protein